MNRFLVAVAALVLAPIGAAAGCNAILGNEPGTLGGDGGFFDSASNESDTGPCGAGNKLCASTCLTTSDPANGCSGDCTACVAPANGQPACNGPNGSCGLGACNNGFADCDNNASDGCESLLTARTTCGSCDNNCAAQGKNFCSPDPASGGVVCSDTCNGTDCCGSQACSNPNDPSGTCVDLTNNLANCGACGNVCPNYANATTTCVNGQCGYKCNNGNDCGGGRCVTFGPTSCGCNPPQDCTLLGAGEMCDSTGNCVCNPGTGTMCPAGICCGSNVCCGGGSTCVAEGNAACGSSCDKCAGGSTCNAHQCTCTAGNSFICGVPGGTYSCCTLSQYCDAGTCMASTGQCPSMNPCSTGGDGGTGCCRSPAITCQIPDNSTIGCGSSCMDCSGIGQCCCPSADSTGWSCAAKTGDGGACGPGCHP